ncbi:MAG: cytochrome c oxidase subunit II [Bacteroidetes bacterium]|nr:MAG: cytochrome c oxidase subunit II [Bacteroidota bacterium]
MGSKLIFLLVVVLGVVALAQLVRVYELSSKLRNRGEHEISTRDNNLNARLMLIFMILFYAGFIYLMLAYGWTGRGEAASEHGRDLDWLLNLNMIIITAVFFLTNTLLFVFTFKYVKKPGAKAFYYPHNNKLEMLWTVVPASVLAVIIILGLKSWNEATGEAKDEAIRVELFSKQFDWTARYSGTDNKLGRFDYKLTLDNNELALMTTETIDSAINAMENGPTGIKMLESKLNDTKIMLVPEDREKMEADLSRKERLIRLLYQMRERHDNKIDAMAWDDIIQKDTLYLCVNKNYEFNFRSKDVIHSAFFPHFRAQMNTVPGMTTRFKFKPEITTKDMRVKMNNEKFNYVLMCNKICGGAHYKMKMMVVVLPESEYKTWMEGKKKSTFKDQYFASVAAPVMEVAAPADTLVVAQ